MNINSLLKFVNVEAAMQDVEVGTGTFEEIRDMVYEDKIIPLTNNAGDIIGVSVNAGAQDIIADNIAQMKFERKYMGTNVMEWCLTSLQAKYDGIAKEDVENPDEPEEEEEDEEEPEYNKSALERLYDAVNNVKVYNRNELPEETSIKVEDLEEFLGKDIDISRLLLDAKKYLRYEFGFFLDGNNDDIRAELDGDTIYVTGIKWGRRI